MRTKRKKTQIRGDYLKASKSSTIINSDRFQVFSDMEDISSREEGE